MPGDTSGMPGLRFMKKYEALLLFLQLIYTLICTGRIGVCPGYAGAGGIQWSLWFV